MKILATPTRGASIASARPEAECFIDFAEAGHDVTLLLHENNAYYELYKASKVKMVLLKSTRKHSLAVMMQVHRYIKEHDIDIVYATGSVGLVNAIFGCIGTQAKMIAYRGTPHGMYRTDPNNYLCTLHPRVDGFICVTASVKENVIQKVRQSIRSNVTMIYKGHDLAWYNKPATNLEDIGASSKKFNIIFVGSHRKCKGMQYMLDAMTHLKDIEDINLIMVGNSFGAKAFQDPIKATGVSERIIQPGFRDDVPELAAACDVAVLTSFEEGLSRFLLESISYGTPVITSDCGGPPEFIKDNVNGYVVPLRDSKAIADKIRFLYENPDELARLGSNATETINTTMSHAKTVEDMLNYFEEMLAK